MSKFTDLAMALSQKNMNEVDQEIQRIKSQKEISTSVFDQQLAQLSSVKAQQKVQSEEVKAEKKKEALNKDLMKAMIDGGEMGPMAVGGDMVNEFSGPQVESEAQGLPIINEMQM
jgi:hypothetical protein